MAVYSIFIAISGNDAATGLSIGQFVCFGIFWLINMYFIWKGTESIKWLEEYAAPILIIMGLILIGWGYSNAGGFGIVLEQGKQLEIPVAEIYQGDENKGFIHLNPIKDKQGISKASDYQLILNGNVLGWNALTTEDIVINDLKDSDVYQVQLKNEKTISSIANVIPRMEKSSFGDKIWKYLIWLTAMLGFWATMSLSIADITRYSSSQKAQVQGQFIGLPGTMMLYSFVGIFVTCAAIINFDDILIANDAPWDPIALLAKFDSVWVVVIAQIFMIIATLSTNIAANVIAPANAFSNLLPKKISFRGGGFITGIIGILIFPWLLLNEIQGLLIDVSAVLGPVLAILVCDYYLIRKKQILIADLYKENGIYSFGGSGINKAAIIALFVGAFIAIGGKWISVMSSLYAISWFSGFIVSFVLYYVLMKKTK
jgi:cytosine/uracil/thiamine/allantoin permease